MGSQRTVRGAREPHLPAILHAWNVGQREWSGDWNGRGEPLAEAIKAAQRNRTWEGSRFEADLLWNLHGLRAKYTELEEARERLGYSAPPR